MDSPPVSWGEKIDDYQAYRSDDFHQYNPNSTSLEQGADLLGGTQDLIRLIGSKEQTSTRGQISTLHSLLDLATSPHTVHMLANPDLIRLCIGIMSSIKESGKPAALRYEYGFLCLKILVLAICVSLIHRMGGRDQLVEDMSAQSQPRTSPLRVLAHHAALFARRLAGSEGDVNQCDWVLGWVDLEYAPAPKPDPIISREDTAVIFNILWADRKSYSRALATSYLPGFSCVILLLWRHWELDLSTFGSSHLASARIPDSALAEIILRYWLVAPPEEESPLQQIANATKYKLFGSATNKPFEFIDAEDSTTIVQGYSDRVFPANLISRDSSFDEISPDTAFMYLRLVRWHLGGVSIELFLGACGSTFAYFHHGLLRSSQHVQKDHDTVVFYRGLALVVASLPDAIVPRLNSVPQFIQEVVANELMGLMALIILTDPLYRLWDNLNKLNGLMAGFRYWWFSSSGRTTVAQPPRKNAAHRERRREFGVHGLEWQFGPNKKVAHVEHLDMGRPSNLKLAKRKCATAAAAGLAKKRKLNPPTQTSDSDAHSNKGTELVDEAPPEVPPAPLPDDLETQEAEEQGIGSDGLIGVDTEVAASAFDNTGPGEHEEEFSSPDAPEEPGDMNVDPQPPGIDAPNQTNEHDSHDALAEEQHRLAASVAAVASPFQNAPLDREVASIALEKLNIILQPAKATKSSYKPPKLDSMFSIRRLTAMAACLRYYCNTKLGWSFTYSSEIAALGAGYGVRFGQNLRRFIRAFVNTDHIPENQYGTWNSSVLEDEDLATELKEYLAETKGKYMKAQDIIDYLQLPDVKQRFNLDEPPTLRTAQRWIKEFGFRWGSDPKGQYVDGHERDVVKYRNEQYIATWNTMEKRMRWYDSRTMEESVPTLEPGERIVMVWFHDESIFYANDRRLTRWVHFSEKAKPYAKGEGASVMVADFVGIDGWLFGTDPSDNARVVLFPGKTRDGYLTGEKVRNQLKKAMKIVKAKYPDADHVFIYDNATTHTKRREDLAIISNMPLKPSKNVGEVIEVRMDDEGKIIEKIRAQYADTHFPDGSPQSLYFPDDHPDKKHRGWFKGIAEILRERGISVAGLKLVCKAPKKCVPCTQCCARQLLSEQPGFEEQQSALEEIAEEQGCQILFLPKFHCELNPIEQCWGYAKRVYRQFPPSKSLAALKSNMLASLDCIPLDTIRRFFNKSYRYLDAYRHGLDGQAAAWANKKYRGHRTLPPNILQEIEAEFRRQNPCIRTEPPPD